MAKTRKQKKTLMKFVDACFLYMWSEQRTTKSLGCHEEIWFFVLLFHLFKMISFQLYSNFSIFIDIGNKGLSVLGLLSINFILKIPYPSIHTLRNIRLEIVSQNGRQTSEESLSLACYWCRCQIINLNNFVRTLIHGSVVIVQFFPSTHRRR